MEHSADPQHMAHGQPLNRWGPHLAGLTALWGATSGTLEHVRDGENTVYAIKSGSSRRFLRLTEGRHRSRQQLEAELDFVRFVASRGMAAACPLPSHRGAWVETVQAGDGRTWHGVVFVAAPGRHFRFFSRDIDRPLFRAWGSAMG
jgi:amicoumacin kinase